MKEEQKDYHCNNDENSMFPGNNIAGSSILTGAVKEDTTDQEIGNQLDLDNKNNVDQLIHHQSYGPEEILPESSHSDQDFFADLGEIEGDPLINNLLFTQGLITGDHHHHHHHEQKESNKVMDPFSLFDWSGEKNNSTPFGEAKKVL